MNLLSRLDCLIVWGHGAKYIDKIIDLISETKSLDILHIEKYTARSIKTLVHKIYSFDYAPLVHLNQKIKYLEKTSPELYFIFVKNIEPKIEYFGENHYRHIESLVIRDLKQQIRENYNPKDDQGELTHDHVLHATDNESQTDLILKLLGYTQGVKKFANQNKIIQSPCYIKEPTRFSVRRLSFNDLLCGNAVKIGEKSLVKLMPVNESVQYRSLFDEELYNTYILEFRGTILKQNYSAETFFNLKNDFKYLRGEYSNSFIIIEKSHAGMFVIIDGLHRAALHLYQGNQYITACVYEQY